MSAFSIEELLFLHYKIIEDFGGSHGVRDENRLASAVASPWQTAFGAELYPTIFEKAAVYIRSIIGDHPFIDGNKRTAVTVGVLLLSRHNLKLEAAPKALEDFAVQVAVDHLDIPAIAAWLEANTATAN